MSDNNNYCHANNKRSIMTKSYQRYLRSSSTASSPSSCVEENTDSLRDLNIANEGDQRFSSDEELASKTDDNRRKDKLIARVRDTCLSKGNHGIHELGIMFRHLDIDYNKRITFDELKEKLQDYGFKSTDEELTLLFRSLDKDGSGGIDFIELMEALRPPMKKCRVDVINDAFDSVDTGKNGTIDLDEIRGNTFHTRMPLEKKRVGHHITCSCLRQEYGVPPPPFPDPPHHIVVLWALDNNNSQKIYPRLSDDLYQSIFEPVTLAMCFKPSDVRTQHNY